MSRVLSLCLTLSLAMPLLWEAAQTPAQQPVPPPTQPPPPKPEEEKPPIYEEQIVVTASKVEQQMVNAPATVSVVTSDVIQSSPATSYAELLRAVPGVNITQT